ncbi:uncharacterized protein LOC132193989 [Neocloeon triangulifer]|uniref:uncharacterized protein LOC132193989 n=1 Tax=Neocloeon triangulifer TaxID=2078957 RepID=UPI00286FA2F9|nr:uncharacterized protein LOC132193989 [Neocloeon triangulifer]
MTTAAWNATKATPALNFTKPKPPTTKMPLSLPPCPLKCTKDLTLFKADNKTLEDPIVHGFWETACGEQLLFGKFLANWQQNYDMCCKLGMEPITLDSPAKASCMKSFVNGNNWKYNTRYWTSGVRKKIGGSFLWCKNTSAPFPTNMWGFSSPNTIINGSGNCAQMQIVKGNSSILLEDKTCTFLSAFACQGPTTPKPACEAPTCPIVPCVKNSVYFKYLADDYSTLYNVSSYGTTVEVSNRLFLFPKPIFTRSFNDAISYCCEFGLSLVSMHKDFMFDAVAKAFNATSNSAIASGLFWTSGTDMGCEDFFGFCTTNRLVRGEARWAVNQPDNANNSENCLALEINGGIALLRDENCDKKFRVICEGRPPSTGMKSVEEECALEYGLIKEQIDKMQNATSYTPPEKCFLKCFGEGTELYINDIIMLEKIIAQFGAIAGNDVNRLMDAYSTLDYCSNLTRGMDVCDKISAMALCGQQNSPDIVNSLIEALELTLAPPPFMREVVTDAVCPDFGCFIDEEKKITFDALPPSGGFNYPNVEIYQKSTACGKKFLFMYSVAALTHAQAFAKCCQYGLRLATVETPAKLSCMRTAGVENTFGQINLYYMVAASRLAKLGSPRWCFSNTTFDPTFAAPFSNDTNPLLFVIQMHFRGVILPPTRAWSVSSNYLACESVY